MKKRSKKYNKKRKKINNKKRSKNLNINILAFLLIMITFLCLNYINTSQNNYNYVLYVNNQSKLSNEQDAVENQTKLLYNTCLNEKYSDNDLDEVINNKLLEISSLLNNYNVSVSFYNPSTNFSYNYNSDRVYYAASTIKMLDAIYIYENAANGLINLDDTLIYQKDNKFAASAMMQNYNIGDSVSIRNLVKYAIMVSDNTTISAESFTMEFIPSKSIPAPTVRAIFRINPEAFFLNEKVRFCKCFTIPNIQSSKIAIKTIKI